jgi:thiol-disulfide isomerase/thioredoxin
MTLATLLLALVTATNAPSSDREAVDAPVLLDFHAEWCVPCRQVRGAVKELIRNGYPVKAIDIDKQRDVAARYGVDAVPTFVVVDAAGHELARTSGLQSAPALAKFYLAAKAKAQPPDNSNAHAGEREGLRDDSDDEEPARDRPRTRSEDPDNRPELETRRAASFVNPHPAETVVRIKIIGNNSTGFGSGTIIHSTPQQSLILTCAHIFKLEGRRQASPREFPRKIVVDLFDGKLRGTNPAQVNFLESVAGEAVDYDFDRDVGLIRIRPGRKLPASRVVPAHWEPKNKPLPMKMLTMGCSEGHDATAWYTKILNPRMQGLAGNQVYEAIECWNAPMQGRSGGGLFTTDFYIAGVCNFAEPRGNHGLYATPRSIYHILDRNNLMALYAPINRGSDSGVQLADDRSPAPSTPPPAAPSPRRRRLTPVARAQSPDSEERNLRRAVVGQGDVTLPHPRLLGITVPADADDPAPKAASGATQRIAWHPIPSAPAPGAPRSPEPTDLKVAPSAAGQQASDSTPISPAKPQWRKVKPVGGDQAQGTRGE